MQERRGISTAEMIPPAARIALERLNNSKPIGGAPNKGYQIMFAECLHQVYGGIAEAQIWTTSQIEQDCCRQCLNGL
jgi:hypothetical protein